MNKINIAIVDDEKVQTELLKKYVKNWAARKNIIVSAEDFPSAESFEFSWSMDKKYSIILLDIQMKGQNGMILAKKIRLEDEKITIIFITAISDYISEGYDVDALNYLIKPIKEDKLYECLDKAVLKMPKEDKYILLDTEEGTQKISENDIIYIEAFAHFIEINTVKGKYSARKNISSLEKELDENLFVRCHRSCIVGLRYIKRITNNELELDSGQTIPISRRQYSNTNTAFIKYFRGEL